MMTPMMVKFILQGALKGVDEYISWLDKNHVDPHGKGSGLMTPAEFPTDGPEPLEVEKPKTPNPEPPKPEPTKKTKVKSDPSTPVDLDKLLEDI